MTHHLPAQEPQGIYNTSALACVETMQDYFACFEWNHCVTCQLDLVCSYCKSTCHKGHTFQWQQNLGVNQCACSLVSHKVPPKEQIHISDISGGCVRVPFVMYTCVNCSEEHKTIFGKKELTKKILGFYSQFKCSLL
jgi:hypothetical protein